MPRTCNILTGDRDHAAGRINYNNVVEDNVKAGDYQLVCLREYEREGLKYKVVHETVQVGKLTSVVPSCHPGWEEMGGNG